MGRYSTPNRDPDVVIPATDWKCRVYIWVTENRFVLVRHDSSRTVNKVIKVDGYEFDCPILYLQHIAKAQHNTSRGKAAQNFLNSLDNILLDQ